MLPFLTLVAVAAALMGMLNSLGHFFVPALSPAMFNVATIVMSLALIPFAPQLGIRTDHHRRDRHARRRPRSARDSVAAAAPRRISLSPVLDFRDPGLRRVLLLMGPGTIGLAATQINVFVNTMLATGEGTGAVSWLDYAFRLMYLPIGLFGVSIATAATPAMSRLVAEQDFARMRSTLAQRDRLDADAEHAGDARPDGAGRADRRGDLRARQFTAADTAATAAALQLYAIGLVGYSVVRIVSPTFYALQRSRIPVMVQHRVGGGQRRAQPRAGALHGLSRPRARHVARGARQRRDAAVAAAARARRHRRAAHRVDRRFASARRGAVMARGGVGRAHRVAARRAAGRLVRAAGDRGCRRRIAVALAVLSAAAQLLRIREFEEARDMVSDASRGWPVERRRLRTRLARAPPLDLDGRVDALRRRRLQQHLRAAAAAVDPAARAVADGGGHAGDVLPDGHVGVAARLRRAGRSLAAAGAAHGRTAAVGRSC